jgi:hypothetical protein
MKQLSSAPRLVGLQVADKMESRIGEIAEVRLFCLELLHVVLAEIPQATLISLPYDGRREHLGYGDQRDLIAPSAASHDSFRDPLFDGM